MDGNGIGLRQNPKRNPRRYLFVILGYYFIVILIRSSNAASNTTSNHDHESVVSDHNQPPDHVDSEETHGHGAVHDGIHVSVVDFSHVATPFIISAWILCACFAKIGFHITPKLEHMFPESCLLIVIGIIIGLILFYMDSLSPPLTPTTFFLFMLPPIILDAGYFMPNKMFFNNLGTILLFAVIATIWNTFTIGVSLWALGLADVYGVELPLLQALLFSSLISAVDPVAVLAVFEEIHVNEVLYIVVFGESLLNDAVTVVLYHIFEGFSAMGADKVTVGEVLKGVASFPVVALGGTAIGIVWGFVIGLTTRWTNHVRIIEPVFVFVMAYLSYLCAEVFHMSGILAITFCGITMKNYVEANISAKSHTTVKYTMKMMSSSAETIIFVFLGVATIQDTHYWSWWFVLATVFFCSVYRVLGVIIFTYFANHFRVHTLGFVDQFVMSYGGLRGAVAFALVLLIDLETVQGVDNVRRMFVTTTITVVFFTVFVQGMSIKPLVEWLKVARADGRKETIAERIHLKAMDHVMAGVETLLGHFGHNNLRQRFKELDKKYIRPYLIRDVKGDEPKILETYARLILQDALLNPSMHKVVAAAANGQQAQDNNLRTSTSISPEALAALIKSVLVDTMSDANIANIVHRRKSSVRPTLDLGIERANAQRSLSVAKIEDLLGQEFSKPTPQGRRLSYSRHSVNERDIDVAAFNAKSKSMVNYKVPVQFKKILSSPHHHGQKQKHRATYTNPTFNFEDDVDEKYADRRNTAHPIYNISGGVDEDSIDEVLPWKSVVGSSRDGVRQKEFPSWVENKDYLFHASPTATYLGRLDGAPNRPSVAETGVFRGEGDLLSPPPPVSRRGSTVVPALIKEEETGCTSTKL